MVKHSDSSPAPIADDNDGMSLDTAKIKRLREQLGLSQEEAAKLAGLPGRARWSKLEAGAITNPTLKTIEGMARALKVKARDLLK